MGGMSKELSACRTKMKDNIRMGVFSVSCLVVFRYTHFLVLNEQPQKKQAIKKKKNSGVLPPFERTTNSGLLKAAFPHENSTKNPINYSNSIWRFKKKYGKPHSRCWIRSPQPVKIRIQDIQCTCTLYAYETNVTLHVQTNSWM